MSRLVYIIGGLFLLASCSSGGGKRNNANGETEQQKNKVAEPATDYLAFVPSIVKLESFDNGRLLESETAFFVDSNVLVCRLSPILGATEALVTPLDETNKYQVAGFLAVDRINDFVLLKVDGIKREGIPLHPDKVSSLSKTIYLTRPQGNALPLHRGQVNEYGRVGGSMRYRVSNQFRAQTYGTPVFSSTGMAIGIGYSEVVDYESQHFVIPSTFIAGLLKKAGTVPQPLSALKTSGDKAISEANSKIKGLLIETDKGDIKIRLFNETPEYRDNFIALVRENYFDSLLIHRVINGFCIQSGAADTRYAEKGDIVGWKGPGYTLPAHIVPQFYHKRGMIGSPRKPDRGNSKLRSDGSQFYMITGRTYSDHELDDIEKETGHTFTAQQRQVYKTVGGAPHIDGTYTIFGEVLEGMEVADKISRVEVNSDFRPLEDIRVRKIRIIK